MESAYQSYRLSDDLGQVDFPLVTKWLAETYWSPGIDQAEVEKGARHSSLVIGAYDAKGLQVGFARLASDKTRFGYFMDVYVEPAHRKKGIANAMIRFAMEHPEHKSVYLWLLATHDAHKTYEKAGFKPLEHPDRWMAIMKGRPKKD